MTQAHTINACLQRDWLRLRPLIRKAVKFTGGLDEAALLRGAMTGVYSFWPGENAFIFACIDRLPTVTKLHMFLANGDHEEVSRIEPCVVAWGRSMGATRSYFECRPSIDRQNDRGRKDVAGNRTSYLSRSGYRRARVVYEKAI